MNPNGRRKQRVVGKGEIGKAEDANSGIKGLGLEMDNRAIVMDGGREARRGCSA